MLGYWILWISPSIVSTPLWSQKKKHLTTNWSYITYTLCYPHWVCGLQHDNLWVFKVLFFPLLYAFLDFYVIVLQRLLILFYCYCEDQRREQQLRKSTSVIIIDWGYYRLLLISLLTETFRRKVEKNTLKK